MTWITTRVHAVRTLSADTLACHDGFRRSLKTWMNPGTDGWPAMCCTWHAPADDRYQGSAVTSGTSSPTGRPSPCTHCPRCAVRL